MDTSFLGHHLDACLPSTAPAHPHAVALAALALAAATATPSTASMSPLSAAGGSGGSGGALGNGDAYSPWRASEASRPGGPGAPDAKAFVFPFLDPHAAAGTDAASSSAAAASSSSTAVTAAHARVTRLPASAAPPGSTARGDAFRIHLGSASSPSSLPSSILATGVTAIAVDAESPTHTAIDGFAAATTGRVVSGVSVRAVTATLDGVAHKAVVVCVTDKAGGTEVTVFAQGALPPLPVPAAVSGSGPKFTPSSPTSGSPDGAAAVAARVANIAAAPVVLRLTPHRFGSGNAAAASSTSAASIVTPMPGRVVKILVGEGAVVGPGEPLIILEAMKMEHVIRAPAGGPASMTVASLGGLATGDFVEDGRVLVTFEAPAAVVAAAAGTAGKVAPAGRAGGL